MGKKKASKTSSGVSRSSPVVTGAAPSGTPSKDDGNQAFCLDPLYCKPVPSVSSNKKGKPTSRLMLLKQAFWQILVPLFIGVTVAYFVKSVYKNVRPWIRGASVDASVGNGEIRSQLLAVEVLQPVDVALKQASWD